MIWPLVVLLLGAGTLAVAWRWTSRLSTTAIAKRLDALQVVVAALHSTRADAEAVADLTGRVHHLEALQPEQEAQRRARRLG